MLASYIAVVFGVLAGPVLGLPALVVRDVVVPPITYPTASTVWTVGEKEHVDWDTSALPPYPNITNNAGMVVLGYLDPCDEAGGEHLDLDHPLAKGFNITAGTIPVTVPQVAPRNDYILVLFGDSGNQSPKFTINVAISGSSAGALSTSTACSASSTSSSTSTSSVSNTPVPATSTVTSVAASSVTSSSPVATTSASAPATTSNVTPATTSVASTTSAVGATSVTTSASTTLSLPPSVSTFSVSQGSASVLGVSTFSAPSPVRSGATSPTTSSTAAPKTSTTTSGARRSILGWHTTALLSAVVAFAAAL